MLNKVKALPHKILFAIGFILLLIGVTLSNILSNPWSIVAGVILLFIAMTFIVFASNKKHVNK